MTYLYLSERLELDPEKNLGRVITFPTFMHLQLVLADLSIAGAKEKNNHLTNLP